MKKTENKFTWNKLESGGRREQTQSMGFTGNLSKKGTKKTERLVDEHKQFRKDIRKPR